jgi:hypothetical protein
MEYIERLLPNIGMIVIEDSDRYDDMDSRFAYHPNRISIDYQRKGNERLTSSSRAI